MIWWILSKFVESPAPTGTPIGEPNAEGLIPEGSINFLVATQLSQMTALGLEFGGGNRIARHRHKRK